MDTELLKLYNTLLMVETKGESTKIMADCLRFVEQLRNRVNENKVIENRQDEEA